MNSTLLFIGCGNMGGALALGLRKDAFDKLLFYDIESAKALALAARTGGESVLSLSHAVTEASTVLLAVKPQSFPKLAADINGFFYDHQTIISIMAGVTIKAIAEAVSAKVDIVRAMPNTPALVGEGLTAISGGTKTAQNQAEKLFSGVGKIISVAEGDMDAVTALSGAGPAYLFYYAEALLKTAQKYGFDEENAKTLVYQTITGSMKLLMTSGESPVELRRRVTSPGGVTEAAIAELQASGFEEMVAKAIDRGVARSKSLGK
jgi:pyrroline-5-carboxylate reductase